MIGGQKWPPIFLEKNMRTIQDCLCDIKTQLSYSNIDKEKVLFLVAEIENITEDIHREIKKSNDGLRGAEILL